VCQCLGPNMWSINGLCSGQIRLINLKKVGIVVTARSHAVNHFLEGLPYTAACGANCWCMLIASRPWLLKQVTFVTLGPFKRLILLPIYVRTMSKPGGILSSITHGTNEFARNRSKKQKHSNRLPPNSCGDSNDDSHDSSSDTTLNSNQRVKDLKPTGDTAQRIDENEYCSSESDCREFIEPRRLTKDVPGGAKLKCVV
jgi:hypothetical protein